ncbi:MAG: PAS domain S-box protein [Syntrophaceae bacterium]|nr:PAS domain S-box protein [Syntrophaceae bacterium]
MMKMKDEEKTKKQLIGELEELRQKIAELEASGAERRRAEEETKWLAQENAIMAEIGKIVSSTVNIEEVYERFAEEVRKLIPFDRIVINLANLENNTLTSAYLAGVDVPGRRAGDTMPLTGTASEEVIRKRSSLLMRGDRIDDLASRFPALLPTFQAGLRSGLFVPLISKDRVVGTLHLRSTKPNAYTERDLRLAEKVGNQIAGAIASSQLFAERKGVEEALKKNEARFKELKELYDNAPMGYHECDTKGYITSVNRTELEMRGYALEEMIGQPVWDFIAEEEAKQVVLAKLKGELPAGQQFERVYRRKDGTTFPALIQDRVLRDSEGRITGIRSTIQDITERKKAEKEMSELQEQLRQSQKMEAVGRLAGGIAHDFNNILTVIKGYSQLSLLSLKEGDPLRENIEEIQKAADKARDLTGQLLAFSRRQIMEMRVIDLNAVLWNLEKMLRRIIGEDIELTMFLAKDLWSVKTDPGQMEQVIMNLVVNARDAMKEGGKLTIETANVELGETYTRTHGMVKPGRYVMLAVTDTGVGMTPEDREHVFEPFFTTKEKGKGTGLGLSTAYGIVKQSEGHIWVYSEPGKGTTFKIYLPVTEGPLNELQEKAKEESPRGNETILVVEDEGEVRGLTVRILKERGYKVLEAAQGLDAFVICDEYEGPIHLLLADVVMPKMSGRDLAEHIAEIRPGIKVLYMSGYTDNTIAHHGILEKDMNYIQKPFSVENLARKVREVLDRN